MSKADKVDERWEQVETSRGYPVIKTNEVIQKARTKLSLFEQKMLAYALSRIGGPNGEEKPQLHYTLDIRDICATCGLYSDSGKVYAMIRRAFKKLLTPTDDWVRLPGPNGADAYVPFRWMEKVKLIPKRGTIEIMWDEEIAPFIFNLKRCFFSYPLYDVLALKSSYGIRLYELLTSYASLRSYKFELNELKALLYDVSAIRTYDRLADFRKRVLDPAVDEINQLTQIEVSYELIFTQRRCTHVQFAIDTKAPRQQLAAKNAVAKILDENLLKPQSRVISFEPPDSSSEMDS